MKRFSFLLIIVVLLSCSRDWKTNPCESDEDLAHQPVIEQIVLDAQSNIVLHLNFAYSQEANITVERKTIGGFDPIGFMRLTRSTVMDTSFDKEFDHMFTYRVRVEKNDCGTDYSIEKPFHYPGNFIYSPDHLQATTVELQGIMLCWRDRSGKEEGYKIEKNAGNGWVEIASLPANSQCYLDAISGIPPLRLCYRIKAFNKDTSSSWVEACTTYTGINAPTNLGIKDNTAYPMIIKWNDNSNIETQYVIERQKNGGGFSVIGQVDANIVQYAERNAEIGVYFYRVRAKKDNFYSLYSDEVCDTVALPTKGLVASYPFNANANDESGNGNHGTLIGATANRVLLIRDNGEDRMMLPDTILNGLRDFSVSGRIKINDFHTSGQAPWNTLLDGSNAIATNYTAVFLGWSNTRRQWGIAIDNNTVYYLEDTRILENKWHHIVFLRSGSLARLYIDGTEIGSGIQVANTSLRVDAGGLFIGQEQDVVGGEFDPTQSLAGEVDNLRFYNRALTEKEIQILFQESGWGN